MFFLVIIFSFTALFHKLLISWTPDLGVGLLHRRRYFDAYSTCIDTRVSEGKDLKFTLHIVGKPQEICHRLLKTKLSRYDATGAW
jgi:hypothetical protein